MDHNWKHIDYPSRDIGKRAELEKKEFHAFVEGMWRTQHLSSKSPITLKVTQEPRFWIQKARLGQVDSAVIKMYFSSDQLLWIHVL